jgi:dolichyl-diphosphooligosaccharide--protein glycosyltransferase
MAFIFVFIFLTISGATRWSGRSLTLLDPTYAKKYIPIIASVSEHQATTWFQYFFDLGYLTIFMPLGFYYCLVHKITNGKLFLGIYGVLAVYFSCVMIRLMLILAPAACMLSAIGISELMRSCSKSIRMYLLSSDAHTPGENSQVSDDSASKTKKKQAGGDIMQKKKKKNSLPVDIAITMMVFLLLFLQNQVYHSTILAAEAYASPSIIMSSRKHDGGKVIIDDYREAYYWLKMNTEKDAKILSWWDYGY